jgi:tRNA modification GTPase
LSGAFSREVHALADGLVDLRMLVEATLDFPEEEIDFLENAQAFARMQSLQQSLEAMLDRAGQGALLRNGMSVVLVGQPNVGKSSLLNALAGDDRAIVTEIAGTTRDALRETITLEGVPVHVIDTAGLRDTDDVVERIGVERSWKEIERADVIVRLVDARSGVDDADRAIDARLPAGIPRLTVINKIDLCGEQAASLAQEASGTELRVAIRHGWGLELIRAELLRVVGWHAHDESVPLARERHLVALRAALDHLGAAIRSTRALELMAEELRLAHECLQEITGEFSSDDLLGVIFSRFCIGK